MPVHESVSMRATVTAGFAKLIDEVKKIAAATQAPTAAPTRDAWSVASSARITPTRPAVATSSEAHSSGPDRSIVPHTSAGRANSRSASTVPAAAPASCTTT